jgi:histone H3/H4
MPPAEIWHERCTRRRAMDDSKTMLLVATKVKAAIKDCGYNTSGDVIDALNVHVQRLVREACERAGANGRKTVRAHDFPPS